MEESQGIEELIRASLLWWYLPFWPLIVQTQAVEQEQPRQCTLSQDGEPRATAGAIPALARWLHVDLVVRPSEIERRDGAGAVV